MYKHYFKPVPSAVALVIIVLLLAVHQAIPAAFGKAVFDQDAQLCHTQNDIYIEGINMIMTVTPVLIIAVTSVWIFISTHQFIRNDHQQRVDSIGTQQEAIEIENDLYTRQINKLFGIFTLLLISHIISNIPVTIVIAGRPDLGGYSNKLPSWYIYCASVIFYFGCISNLAIVLL